MKKRYARLSTSFVVMFVLFAALFYGCNQNKETVEPAQKQVAQEDLATNRSSGQPLQATAAVRVNRSHQMMQDYVASPFYQNFDSSIGVPNLDSAVYVTYNNSRIVTLIIPVTTNRLNTIRAIYYYSFAKNLSNPMDRETIAYVASGEGTTNNGQFNGRLLLLDSENSTELSTVNIQNGLITSYYGVPDDYFVNRGRLTYYQFSSHGACMQYYQQAYSNNPLSSLICDVGIYNSFTFGINICSAVAWISCTTNWHAFND